MNAIKALWLVVGLSLSSVASSAELKGVGFFETLDKPWFATALYVQPTEDSAAESQILPARLEFKVVEDKISQRRFRQLWMDVMAVVTDQSVFVGQDFEHFMTAFKGALQKNDLIVLAQEGESVSLTINYHEHARLSADFLGDLVAVLTARIAPIPELKHGLMGTLPRSELQTIQQAFDSGEPSLRRISQTARWLRKKPQVASQKSQLIAATPSV